MGARARDPVTVVDAAASPPAGVPSRAVASGAVAVTVDALARVARARRSPVAPVSTGAAPPPS